MNTSALSYQFGEFTLDLVRGCLLKMGIEIKLRPKVFAALQYLVEHAGRLVGKQELMRTLWPDSFVTDDSLVQCILELRRALDDRDQQLFKTVPRRGYLFNAEVLRWTSGQSVLPANDAFDRDARRVLTPTRTGRKWQDLPSPRTSLIGRQQEVAEVTEFLLRQDVRLLSLTGPGGAGKTRLALAVAVAVAREFTGGVQFVGLGSIRDPDLVATALADALGIQRAANRSIPQLIGDQLQGSGPFLLVLDNFEQVLAAATVLGETLQACPCLKILVTSRSCLHVYGEQEFPVQALQEDHATELFSQRARAVWPDFSLSVDNAYVIREICRRLDGLPLAIELAAARTKVLSPKAILDRLQNRLQLLTGGALDLPERQQTLRKTIDWSHDLLNEVERKLFRRLSVLAGGCTPEAAEAVCNTHRDLGIDVFEGLCSLVDKNLVHRIDDIDADPRFSMLETIREYAFERLTDSGEHAASRRAQAAYCLVLAEEGNPELSPAERAQWLAQCDAEIDNLRFALDWLFQTENTDWGMRLCAALFRFWDMREHLTEGRARIETVLRLAGNKCSKERARLAQFVGALATTQGDYAAAEQFLCEGLAVYQELGDEPGIAVSLNALAVSARDRGDYQSAQSYFERSLACWRILSDHSAIARCLHNLANVVRVRGDYSRARSALVEAADIFERMGDRTGQAWCINQQGDAARARGDMLAARDLYESALSVFRETGDPWGSARSLTDLADIACERGDHADARTGFREALQIFALLRHRRGVARVLEGAASLALAQGNAERALKLAAAAARVRESISAHLHQAEKSNLDHMLLRAWQMLSEAQARLAWDEGFAMSVETAIQYSSRGLETSAS